MRIERRRTTRRDVDMLVEPKSVSDGSSLRATCLSIDGMRLDGQLPVAPGSVVKMALHVPDMGRPLRVRGLVIDAGKATRVAFMGLTTRKRVRLAEYLFG